MDSLILVHQIMFKNLIKKTLYGLKQALRAWYGHLIKFLSTNGCVRGVIDKTLFVKKKEGNPMIAQIYVDDIVFAGMSSKMVEQYVQQMLFEFEMSLVTELTYFFVSKLNR